jgi:membrane peptidoglycan carboxypeptidase
MKAGILAGGVFAFFVIVMFGTYQYMASSAVIPTAATSAIVQNSTVYYSDGTTVLGTIGQTNRQDLSDAQLASKQGQELQYAVMSAEDKNFMTEGGVSPTGILRAAYHDVMNSGDLNGGSTITQEFVRNYYDGVGTEQTASRKIKEIFIAQKVASTYSKQWIMQHYLDTIYMGDGANGMEAAAETYFGQPVQSLNISQDAMLAGLIQSPGAGWENTPAERAYLKGRWSYVLGQMVKDGWLSQSVASQQKFPVLVTDKETGASSSEVSAADKSAPWEPYILTQVENELTSDDGLTQQQLSTGGYKIVTTISRPMEVQMYKAVNENLTDSSISNTSGATVSSLPPWALVGAELQDPQTGQIVAEYPGKGQYLSAAECDGACQDNTASVTREQVGSSFKPYVLSAAVSQGMNVQSSVLDTSPYLCVAPDGQSSTYSVPLTAQQYAADNVGNTPNCSDTLAEGFPVENDGGELIGKQVGKASSGANKGATYYTANIQGALAASSNTGFTDLTHKVGTSNVISMAQQFGVDTSPAPNGSGLALLKGDTGMALGIASLTVQEQDTMLSTLADNGMYHEAHLVKYWQQPGAGSAEQTPKVQVHSVLNAQQAGDVQYAMEATTMPGGTAFPNVTYGEQTPGMVISKTGTTTSSKSGFFIGATTQYSLVVAMFVNNPNSPANVNNNLALLGGGGFGGYWPAKIWNSVAEATFNQSPTLFSTSPDTAGQSTWNLMGPVPKAAKKACNQNQGGGHHGFNNQQQGQNCTTQTGGSDNNNGQNSPTPTVTCDPNSDPNCTVNSDGSVSCDPTTDSQCQTVSATPTEQVTCDPNVDHSCTVNSDGTVSCDPTADPDCTVVGAATGSGNSVSATPLVTTNGAAADAVLLLPGSALLTGVTRRRKRKKRAHKAE